MSHSGWLRPAVDRVRQGWLPVVEATLAATVAWVVATRLLGHPEPFFAPAAALLVLGQARGQRMRRAVEVLLGVAAGVLVADLVIQALGPRTTWTVFTVILLTVGIAVAVGAGTVSVVQAAVSALYLVVVSPTTEGPIPFRFVDALVGGAVALAASQLFALRDPLAPLVAEARQTFGELADLLLQITEALDPRDEDAARAALEHARQLHSSVERLETAVQAAGEVLRLDLRRRRQIGRVRSTDAAVRQVDYALRNLRVLARAGVGLTRLPAPAPPGLGTALRSLADAVTATGESLTADLTGDEEGAIRHAAAADLAALTAVRGAGRLLTDAPPLPLIMIVGQIRATAIDLLRVLGTDDIALLGRVDEALGLPPV